MFKSYSALSTLNSNRKYSKSFYQSRNKRNTENYFNRNDRFFYMSNNTYNNLRQKRDDRFFRVRIIIKIEKTSSNDRECSKNDRNRFHNKTNKYVDKNKYVN